MSDLREALESPIDVELPGVEWVCAEETCGRRKPVRVGDTAARCQDGHAPVAMRLAAASSPVREPGPLREFAELVEALDDPEAVGRRTVTLGELIDRAHAALVAAPPSFVREEWRVVGPEGERLHPSEGHARASLRHLGTARHGVQRRKVGPWVDVPAEGEGDA